MINIEDTILEELGAKMCRSIDFDILCETLIPFGYTKIEIDYNMNRTWYEVKAWASENCQGDHKEHIGKWLFEKTEDAMLFTLRWL